MPSRQATGTADHLLGQEVANARIVRLLGQTEPKWAGGAQSLTDAVVRPRPMIQRNAAASADFVGMTRSSAGTRR